MFALECDTWKIINANPAAEEMSGYSAAELVGMCLSELHPMQERERVMVEVRQAATGQLHLPTGFHLQGKDGCIVPVMISSSKSAVLGEHTVVNFVYRDITELIERENRLTVQNWALSAYAIAALALGRTRSSEELLLQTVCEAVTHDSIYVLAYIVKVEDGSDRTLRVVASAGSAAGYLDGLHLSWSNLEPDGMGPTGICIRTNAVQIMQDSRADIAFLPWRERAHQAGIRSTASIPLDIENDWRGALIVCATLPNAFEPTAIGVFEQLSHQISRGIHAINQERRLLEERNHTVEAERLLNNALSAMVGPIVMAMEMRDPYTSGHQARVAKIACAIGLELGWPEQQLQALRVASMVHDVGKISIPTELLTKPTKLNNAEWELIRAHPETGYTILKDIPFAWPIAEIVRQHHERLDGSGYPFGLKGDQIMPEAKVMAVADVVEAMSAFRPYREAIDMKIVLKEIQSQAGTKLDAEAVRACVMIFKKKKFVLPRR
jgi:PAS domain S-box-containing protein